MFKGNNRRPHLKTENLKKRRVCQRFYPKWQSTFWWSPWLNFFRVLQCRLSKNCGQYYNFPFQIWELRCYWYKTHDEIYRTEIHLFHHLTNIYSKLLSHIKITALDLVVQPEVKIRHGVYGVRYGEGKYPVAGKTYVYKLQYTVHNRSKCQRDPEKTTWRVAGAVGGGFTWEGKDYSIMAQNKFVKR